MGESNTFKFYAFSMRTDSKLTIDYLGIFAAILIFDADAIAGFEEILPGSILTDIDGLSHWLVVAVFPFRIKFILTVMKEEVEGE
ncbi:hypothetical protein KXW88_009478 [Aspergillus fumigatus]|nr:hypothetical protein KXW88_009478 [Aspergillus fumigatus]